MTTSDHQMLKRNISIATRLLLW